MESGGSSDGGWMFAVKKKRAHKRARICLISGPGSLSKSARQTPCTRDNRGKRCRYRRVSQQGSHAGPKQQHSANEQLKLAERIPREEPQAGADPARSTTGSEHWESGSTPSWVICLLSERLATQAMKQLVAKMVKGGLQPKTITTLRGDREDGQGVSRRRGRQPAFPH